RRGASNTASSVTRCAAGVPTRRSRSDSPARRPNANAATPEGSGASRRLETQRGISPAPSLAFFLLPFGFLALAVGEATCSAVEVPSSRDSRLNTRRRGPRARGGL